MELLWRNIRRSHVSQEQGVFVYPVYIKAGCVIRPGESAHIPVGEVAEIVSVVVQEPDPACLVHTGRYLVNVYFTPLVIHAGETDCNEIEIFRIKIF
jgi:hypothetical protein